MIITKHAIRRYRQRIAVKGIPASRVKNIIKNAIMKYERTRYYNNSGDKVIVTPSFNAVVVRDRVITILPTHEVS